MNNSKNHMKRDMKKINKIVLKLSEKNKIQFSKVPTTTVILANAGLGNSVKRSELELAFLELSEYMLEIVTPPKETFAILMAKDIESSEVIIDKMREFIILTPDLPKRQVVHSFCLYAEGVSEDILRSATCFNSTFPNGLEVINNFIYEMEERQLIDYFSCLNKDNGNQMKHRTVLHFGYEFNYGNNRVDVSTPLIDRPIPNNCKTILAKLEEQLGFPYSSFDQLTVNIYRPGDGIPPHVDTHSVFTDKIVSISLGSDIIMEWTNPETCAFTSVDLAARSVCIMTGESRYLWQHGIAARKTDLVLNKDHNNLTRRHRGTRVSLTFRKVKPVPNCQCHWPQTCDIKREPEPSLSLENPTQLESEYVHKVYEEIADHFSATRHSMWPNVRKFIEEQRPGSIGADIGCGNGKYFQAILDRGYLLGSDMSFNLCKIASQSHNVDIVQSNCLQLPYKPGCADYFISIAVLHHLSTEERRRDGLRKMIEVLCVGGRALIYVWAKEQKKTGVGSHYVSGKKAKETDGRNMQETHKQECHITQDIELQENQRSEVQLPIHVNRTEFSSSDMLVPWSKKTGDQTQRVFTRYYHLFVEGELEALCTSLPNVRVLQSWYDSGNWAVVVEKI